MAIVTHHRVKEVCLAIPKRVVPSKVKKRGRPVRKPLLAHLPQIHKTLDLSDADKICPKSGQPLRRIGEEVSQQLDIEPTKFFVIVTHCLKYGCDCDEWAGGLEAPTIKTTPIEPQPIPKSMAAPGLLAFIATSKRGYPLLTKTCVPCYHGDGEPRFVAHRFCYRPEIAVDSGETVHVVTLETIRVPVLGEDYV